MPHQKCGRAPFCKPIDTSPKRGRPFAINFRSAAQGACLSALFVMALPACEISSPAPAVV